MFDNTFPLIIHTFAQLTNLSHIEKCFSDERITQKMARESVPSHPREILDFLADTQVFLYRKIKDRMINLNISFKDVEATYQQCLEFINLPMQGFVHFFSEDYPSSLKLLKNPPWGFFYVGKLDQIQKPSIALIGSRKASPFAKNVAEEMGCLLTNHGVNVISGGALGCDIHAHIGCLASRGHALSATVVFAGGLNHLYPRQNCDVFVSLRKKGALFISEKLPNQFSKAFDFPYRNRIIAALCDQLVVLQCGIYSGAMNSVDHALRLGKEVLVLRQKGDIRADGCERLIRDGAPYFECTEQFFSQNLHQRPD